jgi:hypothetical protein
MPHYPTERLHEIERRLVRAYVSLFAGFEPGQGTRAVSVAGYGPYQVRLFEPGGNPSADLPAWRLELYSRNARAPLASIGCDQLEAAVIAADELLAQARQLHEDDALRNEHRIDEQPALRLSARATHSRQPSRQPTAD